MKTELFQVKINETIITCRRLSAIAIAKRISIPITDAGELDKAKLATFPFEILSAIAVEPSKLDTLSFMDLGTIMQDIQFMEYVNEMLGVKLDQAKNP